MPRSSNSRKRETVYVYPTSGRTPFRLTKTQFDKMRREGRVELTVTGQGLERWMVKPTFGDALRQAKGRVMKRATKPPWNGGGVSGGGIFRVRPRRDDETRAMQAAERVFQGAKRDLIDELTT